MNCRYIRDSDGFSMIIFIYDCINFLAELARKVRVGQKKISQTLVKIPSNLWASDLVDEMRVKRWLVQVIAY